MMKSIFLFLFAFATHLTSLSAAERQHFRVEKDTAQYGGSNYANVVCVERNIPLEQALAIAEQNPEIDYFVYVKGGQMVLPLSDDAQADPGKDPFGLISYVRFQYDSGEISEGYCRIFRHGDTVFFKKDGVWLGSARGLADTYFKDTDSSH